MPKAQKSTRRNNYSTRETRAEIQEMCSVKMRVASKICVLLGILAIVGWVLFWLARPNVVPLQPATPQAAVTGTEVAEPPGPTLVIRRDAVERHLAECERTVQAAITDARRDIHRFFREARASVPAFAEEAVSLWTALRYLWYGREDLQRKFEQQVLSGEELNLLIHSSIERVVQAQIDAEAELLVQLALDIQVESPTLSADQKQQLLETVKGELRECWNAMLARLGQVPLETLTRELAVLLATEVVERALFYVVSRVAARSRKLAAVVKRGSWRFWIALLLAIAIDYAVHWALDPAGRLAAELQGMLLDLERAVLFGHEGRPGLIRQLRALAAERAELRRYAVYEALRQMQVEVR